MAPAGRASRRAAAVAAAVLVADQLTKELVRSSIALGERRHLLPGVTLVHAQNSGIAFSLFVVAIAALNLVLNFDFIEQGVKFGAPKYMEWYGAFGIIVTLVWLYLEILILLSKMRGRN